MEKFPAPPFPCAPGMGWDMDTNFIHVFKDGQPVMTISLSEVKCSLANMEKKAEGQNGK